MLSELLTRIILLHGERITQSTELTARAAVMTECLTIFTLQIVHALTEQLFKNIFLSSESLFFILMDVFDNNFKEIFISQIVSITGGLFAGVLLAVFTDQILLIPGMLIILPGFLEMRGNISGSFSSRLSSGLFLKIINPKKVNSKIISGNLIASFTLAIIVSLILGLIGFLFNLLIFKVMTVKIILIPLIAAIIANGVEIPLALFATLYLFRKGHDPNNIMGPFVTTTGDVVSILSLLLALVIL